LLREKIKKSQRCLGVREPTFRRTNEKIKQQEERGKGRASLKEKKPSTSVEKEVQQEILLQGGVNTVRNPVGKGKKERNQLLAACGGQKRSDNRLTCQSGPRKMEPQFVGRRE